MQNKRTIAARAVAKRRALFCCLRVFALLQSTARGVPGILLEARVAVFAACGLTEAARQTHCARDKKHARYVAVRVALGLPVCRVYCEARVLRATVSIACAGHIS